jgi:hypothetical protein
MDPLNEAVEHQQRNNAVERSSWQNSGGISNIYQLK